MAANRSNQHTHTKKNKPLIIIVSVLVLLVIASIGARLYLANKESAKSMNREALANLDFFLFEAPRKLAPVTLDNMQGERKPFTEHLAGWRLVNFGYMFCPDICPINLSFLNDVKTTWDAEQGAQSSKNAPANSTPLNVLHITFDPERDKPKLLNQYLTYMNPDFYGLTSDVESIRAITQQLNVVFIYEEPDERGHYFITHSDSMALINPQGEYVGLFKGPYNKESMLEALEVVIGADVEHL
ncbi:Cytochrome oxidase biogenesis protein Sco1/SenC/PrrC [gamma proteobacterium IMCC1989]|nr:Cytochrome oxidase biogenesis protein Sco1/SenC/PrrC [gamma proteobacterium IMCC1989]